MRWLCLSPVLLTGCIHFVPIVNTTDVTNVDFSGASDWAKGQACEFRLFTVFGPFGGPKSIRDAAANAGIVRVRLLEAQDNWYFFVTRSCTMVYGETQDQIDEARPRLTPPARSAKPD